MAVCKQGSTVRNFDGDSCPAGWTQIGGTSTPATPGATTTTPSGKPWEDKPVYNYRPPGSFPRMPGASEHTSSDNYYQWQSKTEAGDQMSLLPFRDQVLLMAITDQRGGRSMTPTWEMFVGQAAAYGATGRPMKPMDLAHMYAEQYGVDVDKFLAEQAAGGGGGGGGGGAAAPEPADPTAMRRMMDALAEDKIGRTLSDKEFNRYYKSYAGDFRGNPRMDPQQHGIEALQGNEDYQEYQVAQKFADAFEGVIRGAS